MSTHRDSKHEIDITQYFLCHTKSCWLYELHDHLSTLSVDGDAYAMLDSSRNIKTILVLLVGGRADHVVPRDVKQVFGALDLKIPCRSKLPGLFGSFTDATRLLRDKAGLNVLKGGIAGTRM